MFASCNCRLLRRYQNSKLERVAAASFHRSSISNAASVPSIKRGALDPRKRRVVVTGLGTISPLGCHVGEVFDKAINGISGIKTFCPSDDNTVDYEKLGIYYVGNISQELKEACYELCKGEDRLKSEAMKYSEFAAIQALADVMN